MLPLHLLETRGQAYSKALLLSGPKSRIHVLIRQLCRVFCIYRAYRLPHAQMPTAVNNTLYWGAVTVTLGERRPGRR
jgi:hypothetical protein